MRILVAVLSFAWTFGVAAQSYPSKPVRIIVPFPPGQAADIFARMAAERLAVKWGQGVAVENRAGGGGIPGVMAAKQANMPKDEWLAALCKKMGILSGRWAEMSEVADTVTFIASDRGKYYNGAKIVMDGGLNVNARPA